MALLSPYSDFEKLEMSDRFANDAGMLAMPLVEETLMGSGGAEDDTGVLGDIGDIGCWWIVIPDPDDGGDKPKITNKIN